MAATASREAPVRATRSRDVAGGIALAVARQAVADGVAPRRDDDALRQAVAATRWSPTDGG